MRKFIFVSSLLLVLGVSALALAKNSGFTAYLFSTAQADSFQISENDSGKAKQSIKISKSDLQPITPTDPKSKEPVSDEATFELFFVHVITLERAATKAEAKGESGKLWRNSLLRQGFTDSEAASIRQIAREFIAEILPLHRKALGIIKNARAALAQGEALQQQPVELARMQKQRNELAIRYKNKLQERLGSAAVEKAKSLIQKNSNNLLTDQENLLTEEDRMNLRQYRQNNLPNRKEAQK